MVWHGPHQDYQTKQVIIFSFVADKSQPLSFWTSNWSLRYLKYDNSYHIILDDNEKSYIPTSDNVKVYTFLDGSTHVLFNNKFYNLKTVKDFQSEIKNLTQTTKTKTEINLSKSHKTNNSPWKKGLPPVVSHNAMYYAINHGC